jgi:radical SAM superfamily enzyme YgiQ (UPF0313 family)
MSNILFINVIPVPITTDGKITMKYKPVMPLSILYLSSSIKKFSNPSSVNLVDYALHADKIDDYDSIDDFICGIIDDTVEIVPDIIAFSLIFSTAHDFFERSSKIMRKIWPDSLIVAGGGHASNAKVMDRILKNNLADYVFRGEGEKSFSDFIDNYNNNCIEKYIKGIYSKEDINLLPQLESNTTYETAEYIENLDELPFPDWELLNMNKYLEGGKTRRKQFGRIEDKSYMASIFTSRGCPFKCTFCSSHTIHGRKMRYRSNENVTEEMMILYHKYGVTEFLPEDDLFTVHKPRILSLLSSIRKLNIPNMSMQFPNALSVNTLDEELLDALFDTGMDIATLAIESGSDYVQKNIIKKRCNLDRAKRLVSYIKEKGHYVRCYFIVGFPRETKDMMHQTMNFASTLNADWSAMFTAVPLVGSEMYEEFYNDGVITDEKKIWREFYMERNFDTNNIKAQWLNSFVQFNNYMINFFNNPNLKDGKFDRALTLFDEVVSRHDKHVVGHYCKLVCYDGLGDSKNYDKTLFKIKDLIANDESSSIIYNKYKSEFKLLN